MYFSGILISTETLRYVPVHLRRCPNVVVWRERERESPQALDNIVHPSMHLSNLKSLRPSITSRMPNCGEPHKRTFPVGIFARVHISIIHDQNDRSQETVNRTASNSFEATNFSRFDSTSNLFVASLNYTTTPPFFWWIFFLQRSLNKKQNEEIRSMPVPEITTSPSNRLIVWLMRGVDFRTWLR